MSLNSYKAARVEEIQFPEGTHLSAELGQWHEEGWEVQYTVIEEVPPKKDEGMKKQNSIFNFKNYSLLDYTEDREYMNYDMRSSTLKIDVESLAIYAIQAVDFIFEEHKVYRYRWEKKDDTNLV